MKPYYDDGKGIVIYHGDCREILPQLGYVDAIITDPPYGVGRKYGPSYDDNRDKYWLWFPYALKLMRDRAAVVAFTHRSFALKHITDWDWVAVWTKPYGAGARVGNSPVLPHWEPIFLYGIHTLGTKREVFQDVLIENPERGGSPKGKVIGRQRAAIDEEAGTDHPLPKPIRLFQRLIRGLTTEGQTVLDPFMGSGTTLRAAKDLGRKAIGIEIEEKYCEIAVRRLAQEILL